jgi:hypothetical protein
MILRIYSVAIEPSDVPVQLSTFILVPNVASSAAAGNRIAAIENLGATQVSSEITA